MGEYLRGAPIPDVNIIMEAHNMCLQDGPQEERECESQELFMAVSYAQNERQLGTQHIDNSSYLFN